MSIPAHIVPRQTSEKKAEQDRAVLAKQLLLGRYLDPWGPPDIVWCHSHTLVRGYKVVLNVYDLLPSRLNGCLSFLRLGGAFHSGIQVGSTEYAFGGHSNDDLGITALKKPLFELRGEAEAAVRCGQDDDASAAANLEWMPTLRSRVVVGWWMAPLSHLESLLRELRFDEFWIGSRYQLLSRNCNHFARAMCTALLRNPLFKPAPGNSRPEDMVPPSVTRLPSLVLALGCCVPCVVRKLDAPLPLSSQVLNTFQGQGRKARSDLGPSRSSVVRGRRRSSSGAKSSSPPPPPPPLNVSGSATGAAAVGGGGGGGGGGAGVRQSAEWAASELRIGSSGVGSVSSTGVASGSCVRVGVAANVPPVAAAAADGRVLRPRLEGRYQSLRIETTQKTSTNRPLRSSYRRRTEDGGGGMDTPAGDSTGCSTPDLAATAAAATAIATVANTTSSPTAVCSTPSPPNGKREQPPQMEHAPGSPLAAAVAAAALAAAASPSEARAGSNPAAGASDGAAATAAVAVTSNMTSSVVASALAPSANTTAFSLSLPPPMIFLEAAGTTVPVASPPSTTSPASVTGGSGAAAATTPQRGSAGPRLLNHSRSGRRVFPDPRVTHPGLESGVDGAHDSIAAPTSDFDGGGGGLPSQVGNPDNPSLRDLSRSDLDAAGSGDSLLGQALRPLAATGTGTAPVAASLRQTPLPSRLHHPHQHQYQPHQHHVPRSSGNGLSTSRVEASPAKLPQLTPLSPLATPFKRSAAVTSDGAASAAAASTASASAAAAVQQSPLGPPRPWSVLSGGFVDLLFSPSTTEPPPGVPQPVAVNGTGPGAGGGGGGYSRRVSSFTGDGGGTLSATSSATGGGGGGLATVKSGDLSDDAVAKQDLQKPVSRARASTGMLGIGGSGGGGGEAVGIGGSGGAATSVGFIKMLGLGGAAAAISLRPAGAAPSRVGGGGSRVMVTAPGGQVLVPASVAAAPAVAAVADGKAATPPAGGRQASH